MRCMILFAGLCLLLIAGTILWFNRPAPPLPEPIPASSLRQARDLASVLSRARSDSDVNSNVLPAGAVLRFGDVRMQMYAVGYAARFSPDGQLVAGGSNTGRIRFWDTATGHERFAIDTSASQVHSLVFTPDGKRLLAGTGGDAILLINLKDKKVVASLKGHSTLGLPIALSSDGKLLAAPARDEGMLIWDVDGAKRKHLLTDSQGGRSGFSFFPEKHILVHVGKEDALELFDLALNKSLHHASAEFICNDSVSVSHDGTLVATTGYVSQEVDEEADDETYEEAEAKEEESGRQIHIWHSSDLKIARRLTGHENRVWHVNFHPSQLLLASACLSGEIKLWDVSTGQHVRDIARIKGDFCSDLSFSPDGTMLAVAGFDQSRVRLWDIRSGKELFPTEAHETGISAAAVSAAGDTAASVSDEGILIWDTLTGRRREVLTIEDELCFALAFDPEGKKLAAGCGESVSVWDLSATPTSKSYPASGTVLSLHYTPDGKYLLVGTNNGGTIWEVQTGEPMNALPLSADGQFMSPMAISLSGSLVAAACSDGLGVYSLPEKRLIRRFLDNREGEWHMMDLAMTFTSDGNKVVAANGMAGKAYLYDIKTEKIEWVLAINANRVAVSPCGKFVLFGDGNGLLYVVRVADGQPVLRARGHRGGISDIVVLPAGDRVLTSSWDSTALIWDANLLFGKLR